MTEAEILLRDAYDMLSVITADPEEIEEIKGSIRAAQDVRTRIDLYLRVPSIPDDTERALAGAIAMLNMAWVAVPLRFREPAKALDADHPLPHAVNAMAMALQGADGGIKRETFIDRRAKSASPAPEPSFSGFIVSTPAPVFAPAPDYEPLIRGGGIVSGGGGDYAGGGASGAWEAAASSPPAAPAPAPESPSPPPPAPEPPAPSPSPAPSSDSSSSSSD